MAHIQHIHGYYKNEFNIKNPNHEHDKKNSKITTLLNSIMYK